MEQSIRSDPKKMTVRDEKYLSWLRTQPCVYPDCGRMDSEYMSVVPAHQSFMGRGVSIKPPDHYALPLCADDHAKEHFLGVETFWQGIDRRMLIIEHLIRYIRIPKKYQVVK